jgi:hypothetical protein
VPGGGGGRGGGAMQPFRIVHAPRRGDGGATHRAARALEETEEDGFRSALHPSTLQAQRIDIGASCHVCLRVCRV